jgi:hypothetical protein
VSWSGNFLTAHYLGIKGSYIAHQDGTHSFRVNRGVGSGYSGLPVIDYYGEGLFTSIGSGTNPFETPYTFYRYFRYRISALYAKGSDQFDSWMELAIRGPDGSLQRMNDANGGWACEQSGCEDMSLARTVWSCRPGPPSPTRSRSRSSTSSYSRSASPTRSGSVTLPQTPSGSIAPTPRPTASPAQSLTQQYLPGPFRHNAFILRAYVFDVLFLLQ